MSQNNNFIPEFPLDIENSINNKPLSESFQVLDANKTLLGTIPNLQQINCFAGANNSGKSRLVRAMFGGVADAILQKNIYPGVKEIFKNSIYLNEIFNILEKNDDNYPLLETLSFASLPTPGSNNQQAKKNSITSLNELKEILTASEISDLILNKLINIEISDDKIKKLVSKIETSDDKIFKNEKELDKSKIKSIWEILNTSNKTQNSFFPIMSLGSLNPMQNKLLITIQREINNIKRGVQKKYSSYKPSRLYIPILRGLRGFDAPKTDHYANRTNEDYLILQKDVFTGLSIYEDLKNYLLGSHQERELIKEYEKFLSKSFFDNKPITLIPRAKDNVIYVRIGEAEDRPIHQLGDGVQALIVLTFPLFMRQGEDYAIFIEEPEAHLHPKWQRFFMDTLKNKEYFSKHQFFITTHSNVFLSDTDVSVYRVSTEVGAEKTTIEHIDTQHNEILEELGYKASDFLNANYILWVEGISDKIYFKQFISAFDNNLVEGIHYTIMLYGGCSQLEHFVLDDNTEHKISISAINQNFGFCVDSDLKEPINMKGFNGIKKDFQNLCKKSNKFCWITKVREIENLIPNDVWVAAAKEYGLAYKKIRVEDAEVVIPTFTEQDGYQDRVPSDDSKPRTVVKSLSEATKKIAINDKYKMAKCVSKLFPKNLDDLKKVPELYENIEELVKAIRQANLHDKEQF